ncbi:hypothetical protein G6O67_000984 [Ophiocordyceps sinensis]|uniref:N-acetyltransferase domain-containing protein n=2 Tax=Ophiocordyceps sinensis TaxID=72228 RepID=A0A8H4V8D9_9HYPO|nr:spt10-like protein [Ophiocordyceps sinensis CO18]KAF4511773.1 hypothetical protein G6O67_000984 [Ophiocordyceps sinensis]
MLDDPSSPPIQRWPSRATTGLPADVRPRRVTLRDGETRATILPFASKGQIPSSLLHFLCGQLNREIEAGDTYPMVDAMQPEAFGAYWFQNFAAVMLVGALDLDADLARDADWSDVCLGSYYVKPNYPGRSSHVCNAGFLVTETARGRGVGRLLGESYVDWAPRLGYVYSVFNLVYETNVASCRIWDRLGFQQIGRVKGCGRLKSHPGVLVDAIVYGRELGGRNVQNLEPLS